MTRETFVAELDRQVKLVRTEYGFTQDVMARVLGISKKTLVEIEKGRSSLGWTGAVALCSIFSGSQVLSGLLGIDADEDGLVCRPLVPDSWRAFRVEGVCHAGQRWTIEYRNGTALVGSAGRQCRQPVAAAE